MPKDLTDAFNGFINILKEVMEDKRVPSEVKNEIRSKINDLINKNKEEQCNAEVK